MPLVEDRVFTKHEYEWFLKTFKKRNNQHPGCKGYNTIWVYNTYRPSDSLNHGCKVNERQSEELPVYLCRDCKEEFVLE